MVPVCLDQRWRQSFIEKFNAVFYWKLKLLEAHLVKLLTVLFLRDLEIGFEVLFFRLMRVHE